MNNKSPEFIMLVNVIYPVGHIYKSTKDINPGTWIPETTWERIGEGTFLYNSDGTINDSNRIGGERTAELAQVPVHSHTGSIYSRTGFGKAAVVHYGNASTNSPGNDGGTPTRTTSSVGSESIPRHNNMPPYRAVYMWRRIT